jgi:hypothetical protein
LLFARDAFAVNRFDLNEKWIWPMSITKKSCVG